MKHEQHFSLFLKGFQLTEIVSDLKSGPLPEIVFLNQHKLSFFYKQPVYKQPGFGWQIAKQLSGFNPLSLSNNKNYR